MYMMKKRKFQERGFGRGFEKDEINSVLCLRNFV